MFNSIQQNQHRYAAQYLVCEKALLGSLEQRAKSFNDLMTRTSVMLIGGKSGQRNQEVELQQLKTNLGPPVFGKEHCLQSLVRMPESVGHGINGLLDAGYDLGRTAAPFDPGEKLSARARGTGSIPFSNARETSCLKMSIAAGSRAPAASLLTAGSSAARIGPDCAIVPTDRRSVPRNSRLLCCSGTEALVVPWTETSCSPAPVGTTGFLRHRDR